MVFECCEIYLFQLPFLLLSAILCFYLRIAEIYDGNSSLALFLIDDFLLDGLHQMHPHKIEIILFDSVPVYAIDRAELIIEPEWYETNPIIFLEISI
jgi:hypothetical protein